MTQQLSRNDALPWSHPVRADLARGWIMDANDSLVCLLRAARSDEFNEHIAKALNSYAVSETRQTNAAPQVPATGTHDALSSSTTTKPSPAVAASSDKNSGPTPRTDAEEYVLDDGTGYNGIPVVDVAFARQLERELNAALSATQQPYVEFFEAWEAERKLPWFKDGRNTAEREAASELVDAAWERVMALRNRAEGGAAK